MAYKRILTVQDISCVGQCSMTVALPILSAWGHETCILPTALLSTHTGGFRDPVVRQLADTADQIWQHWQREGITFDGIYTGYLGSTAAIETVEKLAEVLLAPDGLLIVDPAMADHGYLYHGLDAEYAARMVGLCEKADIILPNLTEAAMLTGLPSSGNMDEKDVNTILERLPVRRAVITGAFADEERTSVLIRSAEGTEKYEHPRVAGSYHGTGDIFAACFCGALFSGKSMQESAGIAADFTWKAIAETAQNPAHGYGVKFEIILPEILARM